MAKEPFPGQGQDGEEPGGSALPPAGGGSWPEDDWDAEAAIDSLIAAVDAGEYEVPPDGPGGTGQGLFVCLPGEELSPAGFAQGGRADTMAPGPVLATVIHAATEDGKAVAALSEDQLIGVISAARRMESRMTWTAMTAARELAGRRRGGKDQVACGRVQVSASAADQLAMELRQSWQSAVGQIAYACEVAERLPRTFAALAAGLIHPVHVKIIEDETSCLSAADAAKADEKLAEAAASKSFGELRYAAHRLVLKLDPDSARRRKERARQEACVRRFREESGNAGMIARELPSAEVLASWQHVEQRALDLRKAGVPGTLRELRVKAYLNLLQERDSGDAATATQPGQPSGPGRPGGDGGPGRGPADGPVSAGGTGGASQQSPGTGPGVAALITITVPLWTLTGQSAVPGEVAGFGLLDAQDTADLVAAAARHPRTRWCLTVLHPDGTAAAHGCARGAHPGPPGLSRFTLNAVIRGPCDHAHAERSYRPSRKLQHLVTARSTRCTAPGCGRPAARCDLDHTNPWHHGGLTCPCNLSPLCRHHHKCKQAEGWRLEQPEPGLLVWRTPAGRTYATTPAGHPV